MGLKEEIQEQVVLLGLSSDVVSCAEHDRSELLAKIRAQYVEGAPCVWWLSLKGPQRTEPGNINDARRRLPEGTEWAWFIPDPDDGTEDLPIFRATVEVLPRLFNELGFFEYYLIAPELDWLLCETDHNQLVLAGALAE